jgi:hypothetical protein
MHGAHPIVSLVYDHDGDDVARLGWDEFILRQWESIFTGYRSWAGLRLMGRRWADLLEAGLGCSQDLADRLVHDQIIYGPDRDLGRNDPTSVLSRMFGTLAAISDELDELGRAGDLVPGEVARLVSQHARLSAAVGAPGDRPRMDTAS